MGSCRAWLSWHLLLGIFLMFLSKGLGCPVGWLLFQSNCYYLGTTFKTFMDAATDCETLAAKLTSIANQAENDHVQTVCGKGNRTVGACWVGLYRTPPTPDKEESERRKGWEWFDGQTYAWSNWRDSNSEPQSGESQTRITAALGEWYASAASDANRVLQYVCKRMDDSTTVPMSTRTTTPAPKTPILTTTSTPTVTPTPTTNPNMVDQETTSTQRIFSTAGNFEIEFKSPAQNVPSMQTPSDQDPGPWPSVSSTTFHPEKEPNGVTRKKRKMSDGLSQGAIAGLCILSIIIIILAIVILFLIYRRKSLSWFDSFGTKDDMSMIMTIEQENMAGIDNPSLVVEEEHFEPIEDIYVNAEGIARPVQVDHLADYIDGLRASNGFGIEFMGIPRNQKALWNVGKRLGLKKNRYMNVIAYDHSRVHLESSDDTTDSTYINANYTDGYAQERAYISTQGPTESTIEDFWRMVWEQNVKVIVMVTNLVEIGRAKCSQYWPSTSVPLTFDWGGSVTNMYEEKTRDIMKRELEIEKDEEKRKVVQLHYTEWPDQSVADSGSLIHLRNRMRKEAGEELAPIVVHCSAGIGRTGTLISLDYLLDQADEESLVDVYRCVHHLRSARVNMVQTLVQYELIYECLLEAFTVGETEVYKDQLSAKYEELNNTEEGEDKSGLEKQYWMLGRFVEKRLLDLDVSAATGSMNKDKNRNSKVLPANYEYVNLLTKVDGREEHEYINAVTVNSYEAPQAFIATQLPMPDTVIDFYRMLNDKLPGAIIMFNTEEDIEEDSTYLQEGEVGPFHLDISCEADSATDSNITLRDITFKYKDSEPRQMRHISLTSKFSSLSQEDAFAALLQVRDHMTSWLQKSGNQDAPVVVHCMDGCEVTGLYIGVCYLCDMIENDDRADVFRVVKDIRQHRPQFIGSIEQYKFLYECAISFLDSFNPYDNVKLKDAAAGNRLSIV